MIWKNVSNFIVLSAPFLPLASTLSLPTIPRSVTIERDNNPLNCPHFKECPGCITPLQYTDIPIVKSAKLFFASSSIQQKTIRPYNDDYDYDDRFSGSERDNSIFQIVIPSSVLGWRTQAKLAVQPKSKWGNGCLFGLYERKSHNVVSIPDCTVHHPNINRAIDILSKATAKVKTPAWREEIGSNGLRYVQLSVERMTGKVSMTLVWNANNLKECQPHLSRLVKECRRSQGEKQLFHSIWCHTNDGLGNAIFARGERNWHPMDGPEFMREVMPGTDVADREGLLHFTPMVFRQGNMDGFDEIAMHVARSVPGGSKVCELYAGVGLLGLTALTHHAKEGEPLEWLRCSDENPNNPRCFKRNVNSMPSEVTGKLSRRDFNEMKRSQKKGSKKSKQNYGENEKTLQEIMEEMMEENDDGHTSGNSSPNSKGKVSYSVASAASALRQGQALGANVLIVDPPRKGLEEDVLTQLCKPHNPKQAYTEDPMFLEGPKYSTNWVNDVHTLIYVSCGFDALARDCDRLLKGNAGWRLESATGYVLFPGTNHIETVAVFQRKAGRDSMY